MRRTFWLTLLLVLFTVSVASGQTNELSNIIHPNRVFTVFTNAGVLGQPARSGSRGAWKSPTNGYFGDMSFIVGVELPNRDLNGDGLVDVVHAVTTCPVQRPALIQDMNPAGTEWWTFEPVAGFSDTSSHSPAMLSRPETWPAVWPDHPAWGSGVWNGLFGKNSVVGTDEAFFRVDDRHDREFNVAANNASQVVFRPDSTDTTRTGLGIRVDVRYIGLDHPLFRDVLFCVYDITNEGTTDYPKVVFGNLTGSYIGVTADENYGEYDDDATVCFKQDNYVVTMDYGNVVTNPLWHGRVGRFGQAFVDAPQNNTLASWNCFAPSNAIRLGDDEWMWNTLKPGYFHAPSNIVNDTTVLRGEDGDYTFGSGYFALPAKSSRRIATVTAYGYANEDVYQKIQLARMLWHAGMDTSSIRTMASITSPSSFKRISGAETINWTSVRTGGTVDIWFNPDGGSAWRPVVRNAPNTGSYLWQTTGIEGCAYGRLRLFINDTTGSPYGFAESPLFAIDNGPRNIPTVRILNEELDYTHDQTDPVLQLRCLAGSSKGNPVTFKAYYEAAKGSGFIPFFQAAVPSDSGEQAVPLDLTLLPNSSWFRLKVDALVDSLRSVDSTDAFAKHTNRVEIAPSSVQRVSGHSDAEVSVHVVDGSRTKPDTYRITFDDMTVFGKKTMSVFDETTNGWVLKNAPFYPRTESAVFDGLALFANDSTTCFDRTRSQWGMTSDSCNFFLSPLHVSMGNLSAFGYSAPRDYRVIFYDHVVDTTVAIPAFGLTSAPARCKVVNSENDRRVDFGLYDDGSSMRLFFREQVSSVDTLTWDLTIQPNYPEQLPIGNPPDTLFLYTWKGLSVLDTLRVTGVLASVNGRNGVPAAWGLAQNYPNPFNPSTNIAYTVDSRQVTVDSKVKLTVYDLLGREVAVLVNEKQGPGRYQVRFDGSRLATGVYLYRLQAGSYVETKKMLLLK